MGLRSGVERAALLTNFPSLRKTQSTYCLQARPCSEVDTKIRQLEQYTFGRQFLQGLMEDELGN